MVDLSSWNNLIVLFLAPIYICIVFYSISYGFCKGIYYWKKDFKVFQGMLDGLDEEVMENASEHN